MGEVRWRFSPRVLAKAWFLLFHCLCSPTGQGLSSTRTSIFVTLLLKNTIDHQISEILSLNFTAMELSCDVLCPFLVWGIWLRLASLPVGSIRWNCEFQKSFLFNVQRHGTHDHMMCLIFLFLDQFKTSDKCHFEILYTLCHQANTALESFVLIDLTLIDAYSFIHISCNTSCLDLHVTVIRLVLFSFCLVFCLYVACLWLGSCRDSLGFCLQVSGMCVESLK